MMTGATIKNGRTRQKRVPGPSHSCRNCQQDGAIGVGMPRTIQSNLLAQSAADLDTRASLVCGTWMAPITIRARWKAKRSSML